jgi:hypothetical protein
MAACTAINPNIPGPPNLPAPATPYGSWVANGKAIPGAYKQTAYAEIRWKQVSSGFSTAFEVRAAGKVYVDDKIQMLRLVMPLPVGVVALPKMFVIGALLSLSGLKTYLIKAMWVLLRLTTVALSTMSRELTETI